MRRPRNPRPDTEFRFRDATTEMIMGQDARNLVVIGPTGYPLTVHDLPSPSTKRWVVRRKAEVVAAVKGGLLTLDQACLLYSLTKEEFLSWGRNFDKYGLPGLSATHGHQYRQSNVKSIQHRH